MINYYTEMNIKSIENATDSWLLDVTSLAWTTSGFELKTIKLDQTCVSLNCFFLGGNSELWKNSENYEFELIYRLYIFF